MKIIERKPYLKKDIISPTLKECGELVAIFTTSIKTAKINYNKKR